LGARDFSGLQGGLMVGGSISRSDIDARGVIPEAEVEGQFLRIAYENNFSNTMRGGLAFTAGTNEVDAGLVTFDHQTVGFDVYGGWRSGSMFVNAAAGFSNDHYDDIIRKTAMAGANEAHT